MTTDKEGSTFYGYVSAEPAIFLYSFVIFLYDSIFPNLIQQKVCSPESPPAVDFVCNDTVLLAEATDIVTVRSTLRNVLPAIIVLLAGSWRDATYLNKPIMYFALFWEIVGMAIEIFAYMNWTFSPWNTSIADGIINGLGGGSSLFYVGAICAITDNSETEDRTTRLTLIFTALYFGAALASALSGYCLVFMGYIWFLSVGISLHVTVLLVIIFVKDNKPKERTGDMWKMLKKLKSAVKRRPNNTVIWLMVICSCSVMVFSIAEGNVFLYYLQQGFDYTIEEAGIYSAYRLLVGSVGSVLVPPLLIDFLKWSDFKIGIVSTIVTIISSITMVFAKTPLEINLFCLLEFLKIILYGLPKSIISKCVNDDEIGVFISICSIGESILPIFMFYIYDYIYTETYTTLPGAFFLASAATLTVTLIFYWYSRYYLLNIKMMQMKSNPLFKMLRCFKN